MNEEFEDFEEFEIEDADENFEEDFDREMIASLVDTAAATALKLTELVVDNHHRNNVKMEEDDIYNIHRKAFSAAFTTIVPNQE